MGEEMREGARASRMVSSITWGFHPDPATGIARHACIDTTLVVITGQVPTTMIGNDAFQEADVVDKRHCPCTSATYLVKDVKDIAHHQRGVLYRRQRPPRSGAGRFAQRRPAGAAHLQVSRPRRHPRLQAHHQGQSAPDRTGGEHQIEQSEKPLFYVSSAISGASPIDPVGAQAGITICETLMGLASFPPPIRSAWGCSGCTARTPPTRRCATPTA